MTSAQLSDDLRHSREQLLAPIAALNEEQLRYTPGAGGWSIAAHLTHLLRIERLFVERMQVALHEDEPYLASTRTQNDDDPSLSQRYAVPQIIHGLQASRRDLLQALDRCDDAALQRAIRHERIGRMTVRQIAEKMRDHELEHAAVIAALAAAAPPTRRVIIPLEPTAGPAGGAR